MTQQHISDSRELHQKYSTTYGAASEYSNPQSHKYGLTIAKAVQASLEIDPNISCLLDHGTGNGGLPKLLNQQVPAIKSSGYDPAVQIFSQKTNQKFDIVTSIDVLEHICKSDIDSVLNEIREVTNKFFFFCIDLIPALKQTSDGRNAHFLLAPSEWWIGQLKNKFDIVSAIEVGELETGAKYPIRLIGCATDSVKNFRTMNRFLENVEIAQKRWIWTKEGILLKNN